jgi:hypothetical protein
MTQLELSKHGRCSISGSTSQTEKAAFLAARLAIAFFLAVLTVGCGKGAKDEGVDPPNVDPEKAPKLTVEAPNQPLPMRGPIHLRVWLENRCEQSLVICTVPVYTGFIQPPTLEIHLTDATGCKLAHMFWLDTCGTHNPLREDRFRRLEPGEKLNVFPFMGLERSRATFASEYPALKPGVPYTLTVTYRMADSNDKREGDRIEPKAVPLLREAFRCKVTSTPVRVTFSDEKAVE